MVGLCFWAKYTTLLLRELNVCMGKGENMGQTFCILGLELAMAFSGLLEGLRLQRLDQACTKQCVYAQAW